MYLQWKANRNLYVLYWQVISNDAIFNHLFALPFLSSYWVEIDNSKLTRGWALIRFYRPAALSVIQSKCRNTDENWMQHKVTQNYIKVCEKYSIKIYDRNSSTTNNYTDKMSNWKDIISRSNLYTKFKCATLQFSVCMKITELHF